MIQGSNHDQLSTPDAGCHVPSHQAEQNSDHFPNGLGGVMKANRTTHKKEGLQLFLIDNGFTSSCQKLGGLLLTKSVFPVGALHTGQWRVLLQERGDTE